MGVQTWTFDSPDPERTREMGAALGRSIGNEGLIIALVGPLGAGKTVFVKGLAEGLGVDPRLVSSPTFVIAQEYPLSDLRTLHHIDLYRLESEIELESIGFFDMLAPGNVVAVEWADRFAGVLGRKLLTIELEGPSVSEADALNEADDNREMSSGPVRRARLTAMGEAAERVLQDFSARAESTPAVGTSAGGRGNRSGRSTSPEMRLLHMLFLCSLGLAYLMAGGTGLGRAAEVLGLGAEGRPGGCEVGRAFAEIAEDALGTLRATCAEHGALGGDERALSGIGRLVSGDRIDLSQATSELLQTLPGIGPARAESILAQRELGVLREPRDLERVPGIGPKTRARLERWIEPVARGGE